MCFLPMFDATFLFAVKLYHVLWRKDWEFAPDETKEGVLFIIPLLFLLAIT